MPFFSVIIPLYNSRHTIAATLNSVLAQDFADVEVIIADDGSTDCSAEIVKSFTDSRIKYLYQENKGASSARNLAMKHAQGNFLAFIDADDYWYPFHLQEHYDAIHKQPHLKVFTSLIEVETPAGTRIPPYTNLKHEKIQEADFFATSLMQTVLTSQSTVIHNSVPQKIGYFDTSIAICEDTDYFIRIGFEYTIGIINKVTARYNYVEGSLSHTNFSMGRATYYEKFADCESNRPYAKNMIDNNRYSLALKCRLAGDIENYRKLRGMIHPQSLNLKQRILLNLPVKTLKKLLALKLYLERKNIRLSAF